MPIAIEDNENKEAHITVQHPWPECTLVDCLDHRFSARDGEPTKRADDHAMGCKSKTCTERDWLSATAGQREKVLLIQVVPTLAGSNNKEIRAGSRAKPVMRLDLTKYMLRKACDPVVTAELTGYISRVWIGIGNDRIPHYISVTKSIVTADFYLSDDLKPSEPMNLGAKPHPSWPEPYILSYRVKQMPKLESWSLDKANWIHHGTSDEILEKQERYLKSQRRAGIKQKSSLDEKLTSKASNPPSGNPPTSDDSDDDSILDIKWNAVRPQDVGSLLNLQPMAQLTDTFNKSPCTPDGNCGWRGVRKGLKENAISFPQGITDMRKEFYDFAMASREATPPLHKLCVMQDGKSIDLLKTGHEHRTRYQKETDWLNKVWMNGVNLDGSIPLEYWFDRFCIKIQNDLRQLPGRIPQDD